MYQPVDERLLQDFLVEAGEIVEQLGTQLVELEGRPGDSELLNAVFRGFHTIKGGAGFLHLDPLVQVCHHAEDVFNLLRRGERAVNGALMDTVLRALDVVNVMFNCLREARELPLPEPDLLAALEALARPGGAAAPAPAAAAPAPAPPAPAPTAAAAANENLDPVEREFEQLLAAARPEAAAVAPAASEEITDAEFERLLDVLHGPGSAPGAPEAAVPAPATAPSGAPRTEAKGDEINEREFEDLLDKLHGAGGAPGVAPAPAVAARAAPAAQAETTVRVDTRRLDHIMNMVGELVLVRNRLVKLESSRADEDLGKVVSNIDRVTADLQIAVMKTRMQPIGKVFGRFPRVVRDLARSLNKEINLELIGEDTDLDKNLVEALADPLVHLVRNAVDHGIESPQERAAAGKPRAGTVVLSAGQEGDHIRLTISDDGAGIDPDKLRRKAVEKGLIESEAAARLSREECYNLIFLPGFSTKSEISEVSGRGVGMDVVKTRIGQLNGSVEIDSEPGKGSRLIIRLPLTLAIMPTLMVEVGGLTYALPLANVNEIFHLELTRTNTVDGRRVIMVRNRPLPLFYLRHWLTPDGQRVPPPTEAEVLVVNIGAQRVGYIVDRVLGQEEVVIKPLGALLQTTPGLAGATITGDGRIALILDVAGLTQAYGTRSQAGAWDRT